MKTRKPVNFKAVRTCPLGNRGSKVSSSLLAKPLTKAASFADFTKSLPSILAASDIKNVAKAIIKARKKDKPVILGIGAHTIKVGLSPLIIDLMKSGVITGIAANGACIVHDFEMAFCGETSEDVGAGLKTGMFGMARETGKHVNSAVNKGVKSGLGIGASIGKSISNGRFANKSLSIFANAWKLDIPATVHVAIGADIIHMHPDADGASIGQGSMRDFRLLASELMDFDGGVYVNLGSAVILPEVFLKALNLSRNLGGKSRNITTVNMDFIQHYRPRLNVLTRPTESGGASYALTGHHEIMFPLLCAMIKEGGA